MTKSGFIRTSYKTEHNRRSRAASDSQEGLGTTKWLLKTVLNPFRVRPQARDLALSFARVVFFSDTLAATFFDGAGSSTETLAVRAPSCVFISR